MGTHGSAGWTRHAASFAVVGWLAIVSAGVSSARDVPEGIIAGPWVLTPFLSAAYGADSNVLRTSGGQGDQVSELSAGISALLPFRNSGLDLYYGVTKLTYQTFEFDRDLDQEFGLAANFNFSSYDTVTVRDTLIDGFSDVGQVDHTHSFERQHRIRLLVGLRL